MTEDMPISARLLPPSEALEKMGCGGRLPIARDCLDPDTERTWLPPKALPEFDLFMVEGGWGMALLVLRLMPPRVSLGLRTLQRPVSCDIMQGNSLEEIVYS